MSITSYLDVVLELVKRKGIGREGRVLGLNENIFIFSFYSLNYFSNDFSPEIYDI